MLLFANIMLAVGCILMAYSIVRYVRFSRHVREHGNWEREERFFRIPIILLILFLAGYISVGLFGHLNLVVSAILCGGSIFVLVMLFLIQRTVDRIQANEQLEAKLTAAEEGSRAKTFFLSNMSHDIRTPLNAIIGYTALAQKEDTSPAQQKAYIEKIEKASHQLLDIVNDVLEMSRIETGKLEIEPAPMDLEACLEEAGDLVRHQMEMKQIDFSVTSEVRHPWVIGDKNLLSRALMNLLSNAGKFTGEKGQVALQLTELSGADKAAEYEIRVIDNGIGMSQDFVAHLFEPFEREKTSTVSRIQGTGLGMAITKNIIDLMDGSIEVNTEQGKGTEFILRVSFPITEPAEAEKTDAKAGGDLAAFDGTRALLVEDNPINMEIAQMVLMQEGFLIETAENGQLALQMVEASEPGYYDVVLMDIQMPVMDGYEATRSIRALPDPALAAVPIIAMTANAFREDVTRAEEAGMDGHIAKPLNIPDMMATLGRVIHR